MYTDGSCRTSGNLFGRIRGTATGVRSASIVARGYDGSYKAVRLDLTGLIDSAATAELVEAAVAGTLGSGHRDQVTDLLAIGGGYGRIGLLSATKGACWRGSNWPATD